MNAEITLECLSGSQVGKRYLFDSRSVCILGRAPDCYPRLPDDSGHEAVSRHHCLLDINPPDVRVRDFGSLNGTYVNGKRIGRRVKDESPEAGADRGFPEYDLKNGDKLQLGTTSFLVRIWYQKRCSICSREVPRDQEQEFRGDSGDYRCRICEGTESTRLSPNILSDFDSAVCSCCGRDIRPATESGRWGEALCDDCRRNPSNLLMNAASDSRVSDSRDKSFMKSYKIIRKLGEGGMGAVYLASSLKTKEKVALKFMLPRVTTSEDAASRFMRELDYTKSLCHPNIVRVHDSGYSSGAFFICLEYCPGGNVKELVASKSHSLSRDDAVEITLQILEALDYAHNVKLPRVQLADGSFEIGHGLIHRDIKPENVLLAGKSKGSQAKVADYGLAKAFDLAGLSGQTCTGAVGGSPRFMCRQQVLNFKYSGPGVDVWAAAATLYYMLTGRTPRDFESSRDPWRTILETMPTPIRKRRPDISRPLAELIDYALDDKSDVPFASARELKSALEKVH